MRVDLLRALMVGILEMNEDTKRQVKTAEHFGSAAIAIVRRGAYRRRGKRRATGEARLSLALSPPPPRVVSDNDRNGPS